MKKFILLLFMMTGMFLSFSVGKKAMAKHGALSSSENSEYTVFITNDTANPVRMYNEGSVSDEGLLVNPGREWKGIHGVVKIYVPQGNGIYHLTPQYQNSPKKEFLTLTEIIDSLDKGFVNEHDFYVRTGVVKNFDVHFESLPVLTAD